MAAQAPPDVAALKQRIRDAGKEPEPVVAEEPVEDPIRATTREQIAAFEQEVARAQAEPDGEGRVDLGPLPEGIQLPPEDNTYYRGTHTDNPEVRKVIETRCPDMDFADLVMTGRVVQRVPILPRKLEPVYQSLLGKEQYWMEKNMHLYGATQFSQQTWMGYSRLVFALVELNGVPLEGCLDKDGDVDEEKFVAKFSSVMSKPEKILELLLLNLGWFSDRVEKLYRDDFAQLKNG